MSRRASTGSYLASSGDDIGKPYQVYAEIVNAGKNVTGTKRRIKWRFGWSKSSTIHEVDLVHSLVSGKRTIYENGIEISSSSNMIATDFSHGWTSQNSHLYRIEASYGLTSEHVYIFSIDGVRFTSLPRDPPRLEDSEKIEKKSTISDESVKTGGTQIKRSKSISVSGSAALRGEFQSPVSDSSKKDKGSSWDPFSESSSDPFGESSSERVFDNDPFASSVTSKSTATTKVASSAPTSRSKARNAGNSFTTPAAALFPAEDVDFMSAPTPAPSQPSLLDLLPPTSANAAFDPFGPGAALAPPRPVDVDPFAPNAVKRQSITFDSFAPASTVKSSNSNSSSSVFDPFVPSSGSSHPSPAPYFDPFAPVAVTRSYVSPSPSPSNTFGDFSGMTVPPVAATAFASSFDAFAPSQPQTTSTPASFDFQPSTSSETVSAAPASVLVSADEEDLLGQATKKLVSLDLSNKVTTPTATVGDRKAAYEKRLSLNELMPVAGSERRTSMKPGSEPGAPVSQPPIGSLQQSYYGNGLGAPAGMGGMGGPSQISGLGGMSGASHGFGTGFPATGGGPMGGGSMGGGPMSGGPMGGGLTSGTMGISSILSGVPNGGTGYMGSAMMGAGARISIPGSSAIDLAPRGSGGTSSSSSGSTYRAASTAPKSSLDSIDWKSAL